MKLAREVSSLTSEAAHKAVGVGVARALEKGWRMNLAVVDRGGNLVAFLKTDDAPLHSTGLAIDKAYTAASFGMPTRDWNKVLGASSQEVRGGIVTRERLVVFGGGFPIRKDGALLGAIGASGGMEEHDEECARAALEAIGADAV
jgi:uncharacterized protein GlcG (DUF336 family)